MSVDNKRWKDDYNEAYAHAMAREYEKALLKINKVLSSDKNNILARNLKASVLIDSWNGDPKTMHNISEAISHLEIVIQEAKEAKERYLMNLGNAYNQLAQHKLELEGKLNPEIINDLEKAKSYFQESLSICEDQPDVWINIGNTLDYLGRHFEARYCYDRAILLNPQHYNAWGNRGICCLRLLSIEENENDKKKLYRDAMIYLAIELKLYPSFELEECYKKRVNDFIQRNKIKIDLETTLKEQLPKKRMLVEERFNLCLEQKENFEDFYIKFCEMHDLFLNTHYDCSYCGRSASDTIKVSFVSDIDDNIKRDEISRRWYSLIEDYNTARFYLALAQYRHPDFLFMDKPRYEGDYSLNYYLNVEMLKSAFLIAFNIYDKVAFLLNFYEELGIEDKYVSFWDSNSIFTKNGDLLKNKDYNKNLVALYSIKKEIEKKKFTKIKEIRNLISHRYLLLCDIGCIENSTYHMDIKEFFETTLYMFLQIKNILFSTASFVSEKENRKKENAEKNGEIIPTLEFEHDLENDEIANETAQKLIEEIDKLESVLFEIITKEKDVHKK